MSRAKKAKRAAKKPALGIREVDRLDMIDDRLQHACDLMTALNYIAEQEDADLDLGALAIAARDLLDRVRTDLLPIRGSIEQGVTP